MSPNQKSNDLMATLVGFQKDYLSPTSNGTQENNVLLGGSRYLVTSY